MTLWMREEAKSAPEGLPHLRGMVHPGWDGQYSYGMRPYELFFPGRGYDHAQRVGDMSGNAAVAACLRVLEDNFPQAELRVQSKAKAVGRTRDSESVKVDHPLARLNDRPNPAYDRYTFWGAMVKSAVVDGNAYAIKIRSRAGVPVELWWVQPWLMWPRWNPDGRTWVDWYAYLVNGREYAIDPADVIHWRYGTPDPRNERVAISKLKSAAARVVSSLNEVDAFTAMILINGGVPNVAIKPTKEGLPAPTPDQAARMREDWRSLTQGRRRGEPFIPGGYFDVVPIGFTPEQLALDKIPARLEDQVCALTGVNAMIAGLTSGAQHKTYANLAEAKRGLYEETLIPMHARLAECLEHQILGDPGMGDPETEEIVFSYEGVSCMGEEKDAAWTRVATGYEKGLLTRAQAKGMLGLDYDEDDEVYVDVGTIPADPEEAAELEAQRAEMAVDGAEDEEGDEDGTGEGEGDDPEAGEADDEEPEPDAKSLGLAASLIARAEAATGYAWDSALGEFTRPDGVKALGDPEAIERLEDTAAALRGLEDETGWEWDAATKKYVPCRDARGRFSSCAGASAVGKKPAQKKPAKPAASGTRKPARTRKPKGGKPEAKPAAEKPAKPARPAKEPKPVKPAGEPKAPAVGHEEHVEKLRVLQARGTSATPDELREHVQGLAKLPSKELAKVQEGYLGVRMPGSKKQVLESIQKKLDDARASKERVEHIQGYGGATPRPAAGARPPEAPRPRLERPAAAIPDAPKPAPAPAKPKPAEKPAPAEAPKPPAPRPAAEKPPAPDPGGHVAKLRELQGRGTAATPDEIRDHVQSLARLPAAELARVQEAYLGVRIPGSKDKVLDSIRKKLDDARASRERVEHIQGYGKS